MKTTPLDTSGERFRGVAGIGLERPLLSSLVRHLHLPLADDPATGWKPYPVFAGPTRNLSKLDCHASILSPGQSPHAPHEHDDEEFLLVLDGEGELEIVDKSESGPIRREKMYRGDFVYYPSRQGHTIRNVSSDPVTYLMFRWKADQIQNARETMRTSIFHCDDEFAALQGPGANGVASRGIFNNPTRYLRKLHSHVSCVEPTGGYEPHADHYDVAILVLSGTIDTLGQSVGPNGVIFYAEGEPHGIRNTSDVPASYLVFEFRGSGSTDRTESLKSWLTRRLYKPIRRRAHRAKALCSPPRSWIERASRQLITTILIYNPMI